MDGEPSFSPPLLAARLCSIGSYSKVLELHNSGVMSPLGLPTQQTSFHVRVVALGMLLVLSSPTSLCLSLARAQKTLRILITHFNGKPFLLCFWLGFHRAVKWLLHSLSWEVLAVSWLLLSCEYFSMACVGSGLLPGSWQPLHFKCCFLSLDGASNQNKSPTG